MAYACDLDFPNDNVKIKSISYDYCFIKIFLKIYFIPSSSTNKYFF